MENKNETDIDLDKLFEELSSNSHSLIPKENSLSNFQAISVISIFTDDVLQNLTAREERIIRMLYGYGLNHRFKISEIAKQFDLPELEIREQVLTASRSFMKNYFLKLIDVKNKKLNKY